MFKKDFFIRGPRGLQFSFRELAGQASMYFRLPSETSSPAAHIVGYCFWFALSIYIYLSLSPIILILIIIIIIIITIIVVVVIVAYII